MDVALDKRTLTSPEFFLELLTIDGEDEINPAIQSTGGQAG